MRACFNNLSFVYHDDAVGVAHGAQAVGNDEHGAFLANVLHVLLNDGFALVVKGAGGFVKYQNAWVSEQGTRDGDALTLATTQGAALLAHMGVVALGQFADKFMRTGQLRHTHHRFNRRGRVGDGDVLAHATVEQQVFLQHHADLPAQLRCINQADVYAVNQQAACLG